METLGDAFKRAGIKSSEEASRSKKSSQQQKPAYSKSVFHGKPAPKNSLKATAPYNFVSLPEKVLPAPFENVEGFKEHLDSAGNLSGEILLDIEALTPLFIGGQDSKSFAPIDTPIIPGSSLRGMFKNIFKVVTCGAFRGQTTAQKKGEDFNDEHIYFRCIMSVGSYPWTKDLNKLYNDRMTHSEKGKNGKLHIVKNARLGFLICTTDNKYFIAPSTYPTDRLDINLYLKDFPSDKSCVTWDGKRAYIFTGTGGKKKFVRFTSLDCVNWSRGHWLEVSDDVLNSYRHDRNRRGVDLLEKKSGILERAELERLTGKTLPDVKTLIPCHFLEKDKQVTAFGHGQCFRIPYKNRICDAVPKNLRDEKIFDFADAVFGCTELWASRVYFEDATPVGKFNFEVTAETHPLMQPNPTSYQLYLKQDEKSDRLTHWDKDGAQIRGYKFYWHKAADDWQANEFELSENQKRFADGQEPLTKKRTPLKAGNKFKGKIRFNNLSSIELGALMMIFDLYGSKDAAYKIGMGKPLGFGSIKIKSTLLVEADDAYSKIFDDDGWQNPCHEKNPAEYLDAFKNYLRTRDMYETWRKVMVELKKILDWSLTKREERWSQQVETMRGNVKIKNGKQTLDLDERFRQRKSLPTIFDVIK